MAKKALREGFKREKIDGEFESVKTLSNGSKIIDNGSEEIFPFGVYGPKGHFLGNITTLKAAEEMGEKGFVSYLDDCSDLSLWTMWNDAVDSGVRVLEEPDSKSQYLSMPDGVVMEAKNDEHGWSIRLLDDSELWTVYGDEEKNYLMLRIAEKPFRLE